MKTANDCSGATDSDRLERAVLERELGTVVIPPRKSADEPQRDWWLIDRAICIPEGTTVVLSHCRIKLSDSCRDNFFRSANCGLGIEDPAPIRDIHIRGEGLCVLEGADHPRSSGDAARTLAAPCPKNARELLQTADWIPAERRAQGRTTWWDRHSHSYGTDAAKAGEQHNGDWRNIGILFANASDFSIENLFLKDYHGWGVSLEACSFGRVEKLRFDASLTKNIDGMESNIDNQDGVDLRSGCHDIVVTDISGCTGDDMVALTAIADEGGYVPGGSFSSDQVMPNDWRRRERGIHDIVIRSVVGYSKGGCSSVRLLPVRARIYNVIIDGVTDASPEGFCEGETLILGERDGNYGVNEKGSMSGILISNVICASQTAVTVLGYLQDSAISNVVNRNPNCPVISVSRKDGLKNVAVSSLTTLGELISEENNG